MNKYLFLLFFVGGVDPLLAATSGLGALVSQSNQKCTDLFIGRQALSKDGKIAAWVQECYIQTDPDDISTRKFLPRRILVRNLTAGSSARELPIYAPGYTDLTNPDGVNNDPALQGGSVSSPAVSDDGNYIAYVAEIPDPKTKELVPQVFLAKIKEVGAWALPTSSRAVDSIQRVTPQARSGGVDPFVNSDGSYVVFLGQSGLQTVSTIRPNPSDPDDPEPPSTPSPAPSPTPTPKDEPNRMIYRFSRATAAIESITPSGFHQTPSISSDGNLIAFVSTTALVDTEKNGVLNIYLYDRIRNSYVLVSHSGDSTGNGGNAASVDPMISANGKSVVFTSLASDLLSKPIIAGGVSNVYFYNVATKINYLVSSRTLDACDTDDVWYAQYGARVFKGCNKVNGTGDSFNPRVSADGGTVVFFSENDALVPNSWSLAYDLQGEPRILAKDMENGKVYVRSTRYQDGAWRMVNRAFPLSVGNLSLSADGLTIGMNFPENSRRYNLSEDASPRALTNYFGQIYLRSGIGVTTRGDAAP